MTIYDLPAKLRAICADIGLKIVVSMRHMPYEVDGREDLDTMIGGVHDQHDHKFEVSVRVQIDNTTHTFKSWYTTLFQSYTHDGSGLDTATEMIAQLKELHERLENDLVEDVARYVEAKKAEGHWEGIPEDDE